MCSLLGFCFPQLWHLEQCDEWRFKSFSAVVACKEVSEDHVVHMPAKRFAHSVVSSKLFGSNVGDLRNEASTVRSWTCLVFAKFRPSSVFVPSNQSRSVLTYFSRQLVQPKRWWFDAFARRGRRQDGGEFRTTTTLGKDDGERR